MIMPRFRERAPDPENITFTVKDSKNTEQTNPESLAIEAPRILAAYFEREGIVDYKIVETGKTKKSFYGAVEIEGEKYFFKFAGPETIYQELQGYRLANIFPHETLRGHHFDENQAFYIQDYCDEVDSGNLLMTGLNSAILSGETAEREVLAKTEKILSVVARIFSETLTEPKQDSGKNDAYFSDRIAPGARVEKYYGNNRVVLKSEKGEVELQTIVGGKHTFNGVQMDKSIEELIEIAKGRLDPSQPRTFVLSQGDPTESNITVDGKFFDFEVAGMNSLAQEMAIFCCHSYMSGHYISPKYSELSNQTNAEIVSKTEDSIIASYEAEGSSLSINLKYPLPRLKRELIKQYNSIVVKPLESRLAPEQRLSLLDQFKSAILMRLVGVKNIFKLEEKDILLYLGMIAHFSKKTEHQSVSEYIEDIFTSVSYE